MIVNNFSTYGQIIYDTNTDSAHSVEFLSRHNTKSGIDIESVFRTADENSLSRWFNQQIKEAIDFYNTTGVEAHVNIDLKTFKDITEERDWSIDAIDHNFNLTLEITQIQGLPDKDVINQMREASNFPGRWPWKSITVALDDYDMYNITNDNLKEYNFDIIKLDRSLLTKLEEDGEVYTHLRQLVKNNPEVDFIVEGVETVYQVKMLEQMGFHLFQGYYFHKPEPLHTLIEKIKGT